MSTRGGVEQRGLATVGVAYQCNGEVTFASVVIGGCVSFVVTVGAGSVAPHT